MSRHLKLLDRSGSQVIRAHGLLPDWSVRPIAATLPFAELSVALLLALFATRAPAGLVASLLSLAFVGYSALALRRGVRGSCGCASALSHTRFDGVTVARASGMFIAAVLVTTHHPHFADLPLFLLLSLALTPAFAVRLRARLHRHDHQHSRPVEPPRAELVDLLRSSLAPSAP